MITIFRSFDSSSNVPASQDEANGNYILKVFDLALLPPIKDLLHLGRLFSKSAFL